MYIMCMLVQRFEPQGSRFTNSHYYYYKDAYGVRNNDSRHKVFLFVFVFYITFYISMYIMCVCLFSALSHRVGAVQIPIIIIIKMHRAYVTMIQGIKMRRAYVTMIQGTKAPFFV